MKRRKLTAINKFTYSIGNLGYGTISQTVTNFIMFFGTSVLGISGSLVGLAIAISAFWDGVSDPLVGYISDRHRIGIFGRRLGFMLIATIGMCVVNLLLWNVPVAISSTAKFFWLLICLLLLETFNTLFATPYTALGIDIAPDYNEQSSLQGSKTIFFIIGMILPSILMIVFMPTSEQTKQAQFLQSGYINMSYVTSLLSLICGAICIFGTLKKSRQYDKFQYPKKEKNMFFKVFANFFKTIKKQNFGSIILGYSVALISAAFLTSVGMHLFTYSFHFSSTQISVLMGVLFVGAIVSQPFWIFLANRIDKKNTLNVALTTVLVGLGLTATLFLFREFLKNQILFAICIPCLLVCGFGTGALYSLPISMFADVITLEKIKTRENNSATYSGYMTLAFNIANSLALFIIGLLLDLIKFNPSEPVQPLIVLNLLGVIVFVGCGLSIALSMIIFSKYKLTRTEILKQQMKD
ncbi:MAG: MFS transporter [Clostridia bacterium]|nr:MFS transporter [Clostridia bacterium]